MLMEIPKIEEAKRTPEVDLLLKFIAQLLLKIQEQELKLEAQAEKLQKQAETIEILKEEINRLKGHKNRPKINPSSMETAKRNKHNRHDHNNNQANRQALKREKIIVKATDVPEGSRLKGYQDYEIQELIIEAKIVHYRLERWQSADGQYIVAKLPEAIKGSHFGPKLRSYIEYQNNLGVTEPQIVEQLRAFGVKISTGEISRLLIENKESFHKEKDAVLEVGISLSKYINVDDTGARHDGKNGYCTHIGNELFAWFSSTGSKSRINFLSLLRCGHKDYVVDKCALKYMTLEKLPKEQLAVLEKNQGVFNSKEEFISYLNKLNVKAERLVKIITEGALVGSILYHGFSIDMKIISDDAGQFNIFQHALCWIHAERTINRLVPLNECHAKDIEIILSKFWTIYADLKAYKLRANQEESKKIEKCFDELCATKTSYQLLNNALQRLAKNKKELLLVLKYPEIPLHNNLSENDIREYVKKRKISGGTRSDLGRQYRDTFISLKKTCRKLGVNFWEYLLDRNNKTNHIPYLPTLIRQTASFNSS